MPSRATPLRPSRPTDAAARRMEVRSGVGCGQQKHAGATRAIHAVAVSITIHIGAAILEAGRGNVTCRYARSRPKGVTLTHMGECSRDALRLMRNSCSRAIQEATPGARGLA
jgi:hypothetical protein